MEFIFERKQRKIFSSDSGVWIQLCGANREGPEEFVLHAKVDSSERIQSGCRSIKDITIGGVGVEISRWEGGASKNKVTYCEQYFFENRAEQTLLIGLMKEGLSVYTPVEKVTVAVHLSKKLQSQIELVGLINSRLD